MTAPILATKLYLPPTRPKAVARPDLLNRLNEGLHHKLTLISAPAGFGKTTLVSSWVTQCDRPAAWLSLDEEDSDPSRFLAYFISALQTIFPTIGEGLMAILQSPQPPAIESVLPSLINEITAVSEPFLFVLDDFHVIDAQAVNTALSFLLEHLPRQMHMVITTREDPSLNLARYRARSQLTELRVMDLRFTDAETSQFLNEVMGLNLATEAITALETRTEGWIAGLQLAAVSMRGQQDISSFINSFTGSHRFVLDYLVEEVLQQQPANLQKFLLQTSILDRLCGSLCDALMYGDENSSPEMSGQETLAHLEQINLFIIPLDNERRWYRYHHLFADLLRQRLDNSKVDDSNPAVLHHRASIWFEDNGLEIEAFDHATKANDVARAERLIAGKGTPLYFRGAATPILNWLASLSSATLDARPSLWVIYAWALWVSHQNPEVEEKLQAAEAALQGVEPDNTLVGHIAALKAMLAANQSQAETIITQSQIALAHLPNDSLSIRTAVMRTLGLAYQIQGDRVAASQIYNETIAMCEASGNVFINILTSTGLGIIQRTQNQFHQAAATYQRVLQMVGEPLQPVACEACYGLACINYEWNDIAAAEEYAQLSIQLAQQIEGIGIIATYQLLLARAKLAQDDLSAAAALIAKAEQIVSQNDYLHQVPEVVATQILILLRKGELQTAAQLAQKHNLPISQARVYLALGDIAAALATLQAAKQRAEDNDWADEKLIVLILASIALHAQGEKENAMHQLTDALMLAKSGDMVRIFIDEGQPMVRLLLEAATHGIEPDYTRKLLAAFDAEKPVTSDGSAVTERQPLIDPLSERELEVLRLVAQGLTNREIAERLFLALPTVKGHNRNIYSKLQVSSRTGAVTKARDLGIL